VNDDETISFGIKATGLAWIALGFSQSSYTDHDTDEPYFLNFSDAYIAWVELPYENDILNATLNNDTYDGPDSYVGDLWIPNQYSSNWNSSNHMPNWDTNQSITNATVKRVNKTLEVEFTRALDTNDPFDYKIDPDEDLFVFWAGGSNFTDLPYFNRSIPSHEVAFRGKRTVFSQSSSCPTDNGGQTDPCRQKSGRSKGGENHGADNDDGTSNPCHTSSNHNDNDHPSSGTPRTSNHNDNDHPKSGTPRTHALTIANGTLTTANYTNMTMPSPQAIDDDDDHINSGVAYGPMLSICLVSLLLSLF